MRLRQIGQPLQISLVGFLVFLLHRLRPAETLGIAQSLLQKMAVFAEGLV